MNVLVYVYRLDWEVYAALPVAEKRSGDTVWRTITTEECQGVTDLMALVRAWRCI